MRSTTLQPTSLVTETPISLPGRAQESAREADSPLSTQLDSTPVAEAVGGDVFLTEDDLTKRWPVSKKTLQRWRTIGYGMPYLKLSRKVLYRLNDVLAFENSSIRISTSERLKK